MAGLKGAELAEVPKLDRKLDREKQVRLEREELATTMLE